MKIKPIYFYLLTALLGFQMQANSQDIVDPTTLNNKIMAGYQGWFAADGDGAGEGWRHWGGDPPSAESISIDFWPDMREYEADELYPTNFFYNDGSNAGLYSAYTPKTVERHVKWMKDYGIDGVFVQRFIGNAVNMTELRDQVLQNVRFASEKYGRVFANMYDISGGSDATMVEILKNDWIHLVDDLKITESPNYLHHNGLPVLSIWGFGSTDRPGTPEITHELIQWFTIDAPEKYRVTLKAGVNNKWQELSAEWQAAIERFDIISPWAVGRYGDIPGANNFRKDYIEPDLAKTKSLNIDYMPVVFPGFSWYNLKVDANLNDKPRDGGKFLWHQFFNAMDAGCNMVYVAMYDEVDEGTAIYKLAENDEQTPTTGTFVPLDYDGYELPSDWYLRLTGEATKMLRDEITLTSTIPLTATVSDAIIVSQDLPTTMTPGATQSVSITVQNTGKTSWTKAAGFQLGSQNSQDNTIWGLNRIELNDGETIAPGANKTFTFDVTAPAEENTYNFRWRMMQEGVNWFGQLTENRLIKVDNNPVFLDDCDALTGWISSGSIVLNSADNKQGTACIEFTGSTAGEFNKVFSTPYASGLSVNNALLQFWYYISDATALLATNKVEIGSAGKTNVDVYYWVLDDLTSGWNLITLSVKNAKSVGSPDLNAINWFNIQNNKNSSVTTRIDELQLLDLNANAENFQLTVINGSGSGGYINNATATIIADEAPIGMKFKEWIINSGNPILSNKNSATASLIINGGNAEVMATYKDGGSYLDDCDEKLDWRDASLTSLNATDHIQGNACIEYTGDNSPEFYKKFDPPYKTGVTESNGALQFLYYVSDISKFEDSNQVEIGSAGKNDADEYNWKLTNLKPGWNFFSLRFISASKMGSPDLNAIDWFRLYHKKTGVITTRLDAVRIVNINTTSKYALSIQNGSGSGSYYENELVKITAAPPSGVKQFDAWVIESGDAYIEDVNSSYTTLAMRDVNATVSATYKEITIGIENFSSNEYSVNLYPNPANHEVTIAITVEEGSEIDISLLDLSGRTVGSSLRNLQLPAGYREVKLPLQDIMPGTYILRMKINDSFCTKLLNIN